MITVVNMDQVEYYVAWERYEKKFNTLELIHKPGDVIETIKWFRKHKKVCEEYTYREIDGVLNDNICTWSELVKLGCNDIEQDPDGIIYYKPGITYYLSNGKKINHWYDDIKDLYVQLRYLDYHHCKHMVKID